MAYGKRKMAKKNPELKKTSKMKNKKNRSYKK